jgi:predicted nucleic acid-binding protein
MILPDVSLLVYAHREDAPGHVAYREWLEAVINSDQAYGLSDWVLSGFLRVVTHPRVFNPPSTMDQALAIESGSEWITTDRDYSRFPGLRWRHPLG